MSSRQRIRASQAIVLEIILVGLVAAYAGPGWLFLGVAVAAAGVMLATFGRVGGQWWYQVALTHRRFSRRRRKVATELVAAITAGPGPTPLAWLRTLAPDLVVRSVTVSGPGGVAAGQAGLASDEHGWFAVVGLPSGPLIPPLDLLDGLVGAGLSSAQFVLDERGRLTWVAVRVSAVDAVELELERGRGLAAVEAGVCSGAQRAARTLREYGYAAAVLDAAGLLGALAQANQLTGPPQEHWSSWRSGGRAHAVFLARDWPQRLRLARAGLAVSVSVTAGAAWGVLIRVSARPGELGPACRGLTRAARQAGVRLRRLDGEHAPAAYACSPTGRPAQVLLEPLAVGRFPGRFASSLGSPSQRSVAQKRRETGDVAGQEPSESRGWGA